MLRDKERTGNCLTTNRHVGRKKAIKRKEKEEEKERK